MRGQRRYHGAMRRVRIWPRRYHRRWQVLEGRDQQGHPCRRLLHWLSYDCRQSFRQRFLPLEELYFAQVAAAALGPFVATNLIDSYDFDGDGFLSLAELMQDRSPEKGFEGALAGVASGMAPEALAACDEGL